MNNEGREQEDRAEHRTILRTTGIIGGSSVLNIASTLIRSKVAALILGPAGLGVVGILIAVMNTAGSLASWGIGNIATRQVAEAGEDQAVAAAAQRAMLLAAGALAALGLVSVVLFRVAIADRVLGDPSQASTIAWLGAGAALLVIFNAAIGVLTGLRRVGDVARVSVVSAALATVVAIAALLLLRERAILLFVLAGPAASAMVALFYLRRIPRASAPRPSRREMEPHWRALASLGFAFTAVAVVTGASQVAVRTLIQSELGVVAVGQFHASWQISTNYIGFILAAMAVDYYPRLTGVIKEPERAVSTINHQGEVALLLAGPVLIGTVGFAHWLIPLLYSSQFLPSIEILRWQILGDLFKIGSWTLGMAMVAAGRGRLFVLSECAGAAILVGLTAVLLPMLGLKSPGVAYFLMCLFSFLLSWAIARKLIGYAPSAAMVGAFGAVAVALLATLAVSAKSPLLGAVVAAILSSGLGLFALYRLRFALPEPLGRLIAKATGDRPPIR